MPSLPKVGGQPESSFKATLVADSGRVIVGFHGITDLPVGTSPYLSLPRIDTAFAVSVDDGQTFGAPVLVSDAGWNAAALTTNINGPGLRERAAVASDGRVVFVCGDGRLARPLPDARAGRSTIFAALINLPSTPLSPLERRPLDAAREHY